MNRFYFSTDSLFKLSITDECIENIMEISSNTFNETGGILIGNYQNDYSIASISLVTGPPDDSRGSRFTFTRGVLGLSSIIDQNWGEGKYYLGEWHYHPYSSSEPSSQDLKQIHEIAKNDKYKCPEPVLLIIGGSKENFTISIYISVRGKKIVKLLNK